MADYVEILGTQRPKMSLPIDESHLKIRIHGGKLDGKEILVDPSKFFLLYQSLNIGIPASAKMKEFLPRVGEKIRRRKQ